MRKDILSTDIKCDEINAKKQKNYSLVTKYECTESGITIYFQMTEDELKQAKVQEIVLADKRVIFLGKRQKYKKEVDVYKMADGRMIRFIS